MPHPSRARFAPQGHTLALMVAATLALTACGRDDSSQRTGGELEADSAILILSNRSDLISGDDALIEILLPEGTSTARVQLNGRDISDRFALRENGRYLGLVDGLMLGRNTLSARLPGGTANATVINHPNGGPVFSGPQVQPWQCQEGAQDAQCNQAPVYTWLYKSINPLEGLKAYDPAKPAGDVASTTTDQGVTVPFIVRVETGYQNRDQYRIAVLYQPDQPWAPWQPQPQWNRKLLITHGGSAGVAYAAGKAPTQDYSGTIPEGVPLLQNIAGDSPSVALGRGFAVMSTALNNNGHNINIVTQAESMMMAKERLIEQYGELRYTIGTGCSGGSIASQQVANAYPGIYQGLIVQCSYPDSWTTATQIGDYHLLRQYFEQPQKWAPGVIWTPLHWAAVEGHALPLNAITADLGFFSAAYPTHDCPGISDAQRYHPETNPGGTRCGLFDYMINVLGPRPPEVWGAQEKQLGRGFAGIPLDNVGVQYGLATLQQGLITADMFLDLNEKIGGFDIDINPVADRLRADTPAMTNVYRSGGINDTRHLGEVAIIDLRGPDPGIAHDAFHSWATRERLLKAQGHADNHVIWFGPVPLIGDTAYTTQALTAMDRWLARVEEDARDLPLAQKIVSDRPHDIQDRCTSLSGLAGEDGLSLPVLGPLLDSTLGQLLSPLLNPVLTPLLRLVLDPLQEQLCGIPLVQTLVQTRFGTPRTIAGDHLATMTNKCRLKPLDRSDNYGPFPLSDAQWARLEALYPEGVCDYSQPPADIQPTLTWLGYGDATRVIYGGEPLPPPAGGGDGWTAPAFRDRLLGRP